MAKRKTKRRARTRDPLAGLEPHIADLYRAAQGYVNTLGGNVVVIGGVDVIQMPGEGVNSFRLAVRCLGRKPTFASREGTGQ